VSGTEEARAWHKQQKVPKLDKARENGQPTEQVQDEHCRLD